MRARLEDAIDEFRSDPEHQRWNTRKDCGGCFDTSERFARLLQLRDIEYRFRRYRGLPGWRTEFQHFIEVDGLVIDWIAQQYRSVAD